MGLYALFDHNTSSQGVLSNPIANALRQGDNTYCVNWACALWEDILSRWAMGKACIRHGYHDDAFVDVYGVLDLNALDFDDGASTSHLLFLFLQFYSPWNQLMLYSKASFFCILNIVIICKAAFVYCT